MNRISPIPSIRGIQGMRPFKMASPYPLKGLQGSTSNQPLNIVRWYGGKYFQMPELLKYISRLAYLTQATSFIDCFGGSGKVSLNVKQQIRQFNSIIYNDLDYGMCCLMATTANNKAKEAMIDHLSKMEVTPETFKDCKKHREDKTIDRIQIAAMNYFLCQTSYNASTDSFKKNLDIAAYQSGLQRLREMQAPMEGILVTNDDYRTLFNKYGKDTKVLKYLDPPYHPCTRATAEVYNHEMTQAQHKELVELLCNSRCWILSGLDPMKYGCDDYKALEDAGAEKVSLGVYHLPSSNKTAQKNLTYKEEFLWIRA